jgi:hypothetical protein
MGPAGGIMRPSISCVLAFCASVFLSAQAPERSTTPEALPAVDRPKSNPIPDKFINLQVLPRQISKPQLVGVMKQFCVTFNVRCLYCHTVSDDLTQGKFDSDEKETKRKARELLKQLYELRTSHPGGT